MSYQVSTPNGKINYFHSSFLHCIILHENSLAIALKSSVAD